MNKTIYGDVFIIPNAAEEFKSFPVSSQYLLDERIRRLIGQEVKEDENEKMLQIWVTSPACDNWRHFGGFQRLCGINWKDDADQVKDNRIMGYFPGFVPARLFAGKKENDVVCFYCKEYNVSIKLTCKQLSYRYKKFGEFEKVFAQVV